MEKQHDQCAANDDASQTVLTSTADTEAQDGDHQGNTVQSLETNVTSNPERHGPTDVNCEIKNATVPMIEMSWQPEFVFNRWIVFLCAAGNLGLAIGLPMSMSSLFLDWQDAFQVNRAHTVAVHSTAVGILFGGAIVPGYLTNRFGARFTVLAGSFLASTGCLIGSFAPNINFLIATAGVMGGLGFSFIQLPSMPAVTMAFPARYLSIVVSLCTCAPASFNMALPFLYRYLVHHYSWRGTFVFISGICMQTSVMGLIMTSYVKKPPARDVKTTCVDEHENTMSYLLSNENTGDVLVESKVEYGNEQTPNGNEEKYDQLTNRTTEEIISNEENRQLNQEERHDFTRTSRSPVLQRFREFRMNLKNSKWRFLMDKMFILFVTHTCTCLSSTVSVILIMMDFARSKGFPGDTTGVFFLFVIFLSSIAGRLLIGPLNMLPYLHSRMITGLFGSLASVSIIVLGSATEYTTVVVFLTVKGIGLGGMVGISAKCILDTDSVSMSNYPLALGVTDSMEGTSDVLLPIFIGLVVDSTESYTAIFHGLGTISLITSLTLGIVETKASFKAYSRNKAGLTENVQMQ